MSKAPLKRKSTCVHCGETRAVRADGKIGRHTIKHNGKAIRGSVCKGVGFPPLLTCVDCGRAGREVLFPYQAEINGVDVEMILCDPCQHQRYLEV